MCVCNICITLNCTVILKKNNDDDDDDKPQESRKCPLHIRLVKRSVKCDWRVALNVICVPCQNQLFSESLPQDSLLPSGLTSQTLASHRYFIEHINTKNCSLSIVLTATDKKPQKSVKRSCYSASRWHSGNVMVGNITFLMIFAVFDVSPLTLWINCSF